MQLCRTRFVTPPDRALVVDLGDSNELYMLVLTAAIVTLVALAATSAFPLLLPTVQSISARHSHMGLLSNAVSRYLYLSIYLGIYISLYWYLDI